MRCDMPCLNSRENCINNGCTALCCATASAEEEYLASSQHAEGNRFMNKALYCGRLCSFVKPRAPAENMGEVKCIPPTGKTLVQNVIHASMPVRN